MAKTNPAQYIRDKVVELRDVLNASGNIAFQRVGRAVSVDAERIMKIGAYPALMLTHLGGELEDANSEIWVRRFGATIVEKSAWDAWGDHVAGRLDVLTELLIDTLQESREDDAIACIFESEDQTIMSDNLSADYAFRTLIFEYTIDREVS